MLNLFGKSKTKPRQFNWQETQKGIRFTAPLANLSVAEYAENLSADAYHAQAQWVLLKELLDNGQAELSDVDIHIPSEEVCRLDFAEQSLLGLPEPYPFDLEVRSDRTLKGKRSFVTIISFYSRIESPCIHSESAAYCG